MHEEHEELLELAKLIETEMTAEQEERFNELEDYFDKIAYCDCGERIS